MVERPSPDVDGAPVMPRAEAVAAARAAVMRSREKRDLDDRDGENPGCGERERERWGWATDGGEHRARQEEERAQSARRQAPAEHLAGGHRSKAEEEDEHEYGAEFGPQDGSEPERVGGGFFTDPVDRWQGSERETEKPLPLRQRWGLALEERLPVWLRLRCGVEPKTLVALALVLLVAVGFAVHHFWAGEPEGVAVPSSGTARDAGSTAHSPGASPMPGSRGTQAGGAQGASAGPSSGKQLVIDISGKVHDPGVHRLPAGSRVTDALEAAGGLRKGADTRGLNQARLLVDGEQIVVGEPGKDGAPPAAAPGGTATGGAASGGASGAPAAPISLSSATPEQLENLPGVGPVLAQHIVDYRTEHGGFSSVDQLKQVNGIGEKRFADIEPQVSP